MTMELRVLRGAPTDDEVAAVTVALLACAALPAAIPPDATPRRPARTVGWALPGGFRAPRSWAAR